MMFRLLLLLMLVLVGAIVGVRDDEIEIDISLTSTSPKQNITKLDCAMRQLAVEYARKTLLDNNKPTSSATDDLLVEEVDEDHQDDAQSRAKGPVAHGHKLLL